ncbi:MAG: cell filamentation protein Fic [Planctomycetes bacterium]|nr:cell filamentation protein Fic [Planctomycetota bacterium]
MADDSRLGTYVVTSAGGEDVRAFLPPPLPPDPPLELSPADFDLLERANRALGRLDGLAAVLPDTALFVYMYVRKEAVLSSQIEGTQSSLSDLLAHEISGELGVPLDDVVEVSSYVAALDHGLERMRGGFPLSLRLVREIHGILLSHGRGANKAPGEFRRSQNWIGGTRPGAARYVPPPPERLMDCLDAFEKFLHDQPGRTSLLIKAALAHVQFETIHPFLDCNGRLGRLLITLLLCAEEALSEPILYLSLHFKTHRDEYYERLQRVRTHGEWEEWLRFFLDGVLTVSHQAVDTARAILALFDKDRRSLQALGRPAGSALQMHEALQKRPLLDVATAAQLTGLSLTTASTSFARMTDLGIVRELTGRRRDRLFAYGPYLDLLAQGTEPIR